LFPLKTKAAFVKRKMGLIDIKLNRTGVWYRILQMCQEKKRCNCNRKEKLIECPGKK
jgi:hypothetical protein